MAKKGTTRGASSAQEKRLANELGAKIQPNSGATTFKKGDLVDDLFIYECKTTMINQESISFKAEWLDTLEKERRALGKEFKALLITLGKSDAVVLDLKTFKKLLEAYRQIEEA